MDCPTIDFSLDTIFGVKDIVLGKFALRPEAHVALCRTSTQNCPGGVWAYGYGTGGSGQPAPVNNDTEKYWKAVELTVPRIAAESGRVTVPIQ